MSRHPSRRRQLNTFGSQARRANGSGEQVATDFDELKMLLDSSDQEPLVVKGPTHLSTHHGAMEIPSEPVTSAEISVEFPTDAYVSQPDGSVLFADGARLIASKLNPEDVFTDVESSEKEQSTLSQLAEKRQGSKTIQPAATLTSPHITDPRITGGKLDLGTTGDFEEAFRGRMTEEALRQVRTQPSLGQAIHSKVANVIKNSRAYQKQVGDVMVDVQELARNISVTAHTDRIRRGMEEVLTDAEPPMVQNASVTHMDVRDRRIETLPQPDILYCVVKTVKDQCDSMEVLMDEIMKEIDDSMRVVRSEGGHRMTVAFWEDTPGMRAYAAYLNEVLDRQSAPDLIIWIKLPYGLVIPTYQLRGAMMENYHVKVHTLHNTFMLGD